MFLENTNCAFFALYKTFMNKSIDLIEKKFDVDLLEIKNIYPVLIGKICEKLNIDVVFSQDLDDDYFGNIIKNPTSYTINVNANYSAATNMFTIAHEIGHYVKHNDKLAANGQFMDRKSSGYTAEERQNERQANDFAGELLMPSEKFCEIYNEKSGNIKNISSFFRLSADLVSFRAIKLGLIIVSHE